MEDSEEIKTQVESQFQAVLSEAAKIYKKSSGKNINDFMTPPMTSVNDLMQQVDGHNDSFSTFRSKRAGLFNVLSAMLEPLEIIGGIVSGAASQAFPASQNIYSAVLYLINGANDVSSTYDTILELFEELKDFTSRLTVYAKYKMSPGLRTKVVTIFATIFEVLVLSTEEINQGRIKAYFKSLVRMGSPVKGSLEKLKKLNVGEERQVLADTYGGVTRIDIKTDRVENIVSQVNQDVKELKAEYKKRTTVAHQDKLRELLEPSPFPEDYYSQFTRHRVDNTGDWLLEDTGVRSWMGCETPFMWMSGGPGTGKSFLTSKLISYGADNMSHVAYFYFRSNDPETRSVLQAMRDIAFQLSESDGFYGKEITRLVHSPDDIKTIPSAFRLLFVEPFDNDTRDETFYVFLDGIDEAENDEIEELLGQFEILVDKSQQQGRPKVQICLVGRSFMSDMVSLYLDTQTAEHTLTVVQITTDRNAQDVKAFIEDGVSRSRILSRSDPELRQKVIDTMEKRVDGLFILAKFMMADINRKRRPHSILESLESFPTEIHGMMKMTLENLASTITEEEAEDLNEVLTWVACAQQALTLEQLEAVLIFKYSDPPFRFEDSLRGQYASFFELERDDGLTTDDLVKDFERLQREGKRSSTPNGRQRRSSSATRQPMSRNVSPSQKLSATSRRRTSPSTLEAGPTRHLSPSRSPVRLPEIPAPDQEMEFRSKKSTTTVTFFHASVREFFRDEDMLGPAGSKKGPAIGFNTIAAKVHVLTTCLRIFNDKKWFNGQHLDGRTYAIRQYAAWYWQEHLASIDPKTVDKDQKGIIGQQVYKMLVDEETLSDWSLMYEEYDEGMEVFTDENIKALRTWLKDSEVMEKLPPEGKEWAQKCIDKPSNLFHEIGRFYSKAWLDKDCEQYVPTKFCFKIVQSIAFMDDGQKWSDSQRHWKDIPLSDRINKATEWAKFSKTAHWYRRVGSTYLTMGQHDDALVQYEEGLKLDNDNIELSGRKAFCLSKDRRYYEALQLALKCEATELRLVAQDNVPDPKLAASRWRLYKDQYLIAHSYHRVGDEEKSIEYFHKALESGNRAGLGYKERFEPVEGFLEVLARHNKYDEIMKVVESLSLQASGPHMEQSRLIDFLLSHHSTALVMEWIPKAAYKTDQADFLIERLNIAMDFARQKRDAVKELYLRISIGATLVYKRDIDLALEVFEQISLVEYRPRGNVPTRQAHAISFQILATIYKDMALHAGIHGPEADRWIQRLEVVQGKQGSSDNSSMPASMLGSDFNAAAIYLAHFYRLRDRSKEAMALLGHQVVESCEILEDEDLLNDKYALENLLRLFVAAGKDEEVNARALAVSMRRINPDCPVMTPAESPVLQRDARPLPKLPDIQSWDRSCARCLEIISPTQEFYMCWYCLDSYCRRCINDEIKPGNGPVGVGVVCRADHEWFEVPPLDKILHTGELLVDGHVTRFAEWEDQIKKKWREKTGMN